VTVRTLVIALLAALLGAAVASGVTFHHMRGEVLRMEVDAFNDGFLDGACNKRAYEDGSYVWEDGNGRLCR
jgi:hypothetical protein